MFPWRSRLRLMVLCCSLFASGVVVPCALVVLIRQSDVTADLPPEADDGRSEGRSHSAERNAMAYREGKVQELKLEIAELENIKMSARNELLQLEHKLSQAKFALSASTMGSIQHTTPKVEVGEDWAGENELRAHSASKTAALDCPPPPSLVQPPPIIVLSQLKHTTAVKEDIDTVDSASPDANARCSFPACFDYSRCPLTRPFSVYVYGDPAPGYLPLDHVTRTLLIEILNSTSSLAPRPQDACLLLVTADMRTLDAAGLERLLPHWGVAGANHVLIGLHNGPNIPLQTAKIGRAIVLGNTLYSTRRFRSGYDILVASVPSSHGNPNPTDLPSILPELRKSLLYFSGRLVPIPPGATPTSPNIEPSTLEALRDALVGIDVVTMDTTCLEGGVAKGEVAMEGEWALCGDRSARLDNHAHSTFSLVLPGGGGAMGGATFSRLLESLQAGSVPVVVGVPVLPLDDVIDWSRAALLVPLSRFGELHYILRSVASVTVAQYRLQGRMIWHAYLSSLRQGLSSAIAVLRQRTGHPPPLVPDYVARTLATTGTVLQSAVSPSFIQNWTVYAGDIWNRPPGPFYTYPLTPYKPVPLSGVQYEGVASSALLLLPPHIVQAGGTTGEEFENYLLGNTPVEYFTIVMLTYQRNDVVLEALKRLHGLRYLAKVIIIWNNEEDPIGSMEWPDIGVRVEVVTVGVNSLNNRFLPLSNIQTEAILSLDDDVYLRHDEIQFAFRVWRESRDRIVGFPGRFHVWDVRHGGWLYNSNYTCELSMVLTGAAFYHKYYSYLYTYWLPREIRDIVDEYMNCEDIAMNFLVSYITRKPPIKVTSRWTFKCPGCPETLSKVESHFDERHLCLNRFTRVMGHMPLLFTQYRADSVLFKTRLPSHLHKCYEYI